MFKLQEVVHKFRSGGSPGGDGKKEGEGGMDDSTSQPTSSVCDSGTTVTTVSTPPYSRGSTSATMDQSKGERRGDTIWYVDHSFSAEPPKGEKGELSSLSLLTAAGLQHTVLAVLRQTDPIAADAALMSDATDGSSKGTPTSPEKRLSKMQPMGTMEYQVKASDTLERIAAHHDITPSELQKLNKMTSRMVFAGQVLYIPDPDYVPSDPPTPEPPSSPPVSPTFDSRPKLDVPLVKMADKPPERVPGHAIKIPSPSSASIVPTPFTLSEEEARKLDQECFERFIKLCAKYISDGMGNVRGTLIVTPNAIMFDPNVLDPLVVENGSESFGVVVYMDTILSAALYHDLSAMRYHTRSNSELEVIERPLIYHGDLRPRSASTSSLMSSSSAACTSQGVTASHSASGLSPFFSASGAKAQNSPVKKGTQPGSQRESSMDVVDATADRRQMYGEIKIVGRAAMRSDHDGQTAVAVEGVQTGETGTDELSAGEATSKEDATEAPLMTFDLSSISGLGSGVVEKTADTSHETLEMLQPETAQTAPGKESTSVTAAGSVSEVSDVDLLSLDPFAPKVEEGAAISNQDPEDQSGVPSLAVDLLTGETTSSSQDRREDSADREAEKLSVPVQETADWLAQDSVGVPAPVSVDDRSAESVQVFEKSSTGSSENVGLPQEGGDGAATTAKPKDSMREKWEEDGGGDVEGGGKEREEMRIGNIVYLPVKESSTGEMIVRNNNENLIPVSSAQEAAKVDDEGEDREAEDTVDGSGSGSRLASGSFSPLRSSAQQISNFVSYATGFFRSTDEDHRDVHDVPRSQGSGVTEPEASKRRWASGPPGSSKASARMAKNAVSAVRADERPDLFRDIQKHGLIQHTPEEDDQPPLYLHLHVNTVQCDRQVAASTPREKYRYRQVSTKPHYWFSIPRNKVDNLYAFFLQWRPEIYGDEEDINPEEQGFVVVENTDVEGADAKLDIVEEYFGAHAASFKKDWELVSREEARRRQPSVDTEPVSMPELSQESSILTTRHIIELSEHLPPRTIGYRWTLVYSTALHGFSLKRLYRDVGRLDSPILLILQDTAGIIFGAYVSHPPRFSDHFYGNGTSQLWTFKDGFKVFNWTGDNTFFIKGNEDSLSVGAGAGQFGLWLDGDLYHGRSHQCETFSNCVLSSQEDFFVKGMEAWAFE